MKLRHQGLLLLAIPLLFEFVAVSFLLFSLVQFEKEAKAESRAKQIVAQSDDIKITVTASYVGLVSLRYLHQRPDTTAEISRQLIKAKFDSLKAVIGNDPPVSKLADEYESEALHVQDLVEDGFGSFEKGGHGFDQTFAQFIDGKDFVEELAESLGRVVKVSRDLSGRFAAVSRQFRPQEEQYRENVRRLILVALAGNVIIVLSLAVVYSRSTMRRFDQLMANIHSLSGDRGKSRPVEGNDELAELDKAFQYSAQARYEAEEEKTFLMHMVSHDLRSPLTGIGGILQLASNGIYGECTPKLSQKISTASMEVQRLMRLVNDLLAAERIKSGEIALSKAPETVNGLFAESCEPIKQMADAASVSIVCEPAEDSLKVYCDRERVRQVIVNLVTNAIRFSPAGKTVTLRAVRLDRGLVRVEVRDQGPGLKAEDHSVIFEKFVQAPSTASSDSRNSGLGLAICKTLVQLHGGRIGVDSESGVGSTFWFELPDADHAG